jgi:hypothetical protein
MGKFKRIKRGIKMKKLAIILAFMTSFVFADVKSDFIYEVENRGCQLTTWIENDFESGVEWKYYAKFTCTSKVKLPTKIYGLQFLDVSYNLKGEQVFTYGVEK